jgi:hypothetical protein
MKLRPWTVCGCVVLVASLSVLFIFPPVAAPSREPSASQERETQPGLGSAVPGQAAEERFVYFPNQYVNQAQEPAAPIATF